MRLMLVESKYEGHHLMYIRRLVDGLGPLVESIVFVTEQGVPQTAEFRQHLGPVVERITIDDSLNNKSGGSIRRYWSERLLHLADRIKYHQAQHVILPTGDGIAVYAGTARLMGKKAPWQDMDVEIEANLIRTYIGYPVHGMKAKLKQCLIRASLKCSPLQSIYMIDFVAREQLLRTHPKLAARLSLLPDPLDPMVPPEKIAARMALGLPPDGRLIGTVGFMEPRKGIGRFLEAFRLAKLEPNDRMLLAGRFNAEIRQLLNNQFADLVASGRVIVIDRYMPDAELLTALSAMDLVCTPYVDHLGPSGVTIRAMAVDRPVLSTNCGWANEAIPRFKLGWVCDTANIELFAREIRLRLDEAANFIPSPAGQRLKRYLSAENFSATWSQRLRQRLGLPPDPNLLTWDWVTSAVSA